MIRTYTAIFLAAVLAAPVLPGAPQGAVADTLKVHVLQGNGAVNNLQTGNITPPVVEVRDENDAPVEGADVVFHLPASGPGGIFADQKFVFTTKTNSQGQAGCARFKPGTQTGRFEIQVSVSMAGRTGHAVVHQTNSASQFATETRQASGLSRKKWWLIAGGLAGGAAVGGLLATRGGGSTSSSSAFTITAGAISFGPPR